MSDLPGYRFAGFVVSRRRRQLLRGDAVLPLIPRYFDLLVLLLERRPAVVTRREIFDVVWGDVIVSDGALTQAIRTLRRTLGDDPRAPLFIRTVSRHGYSFVFVEVEEGDEGGAPRPDRHRGAAAHLGAVDLPGDALPALVDRVLGAGGGGSLEDRRDAAQQLHQMGTALAIEAIMARPGHADALALMRDTRWDVPAAGPVPLWGQPEGLAAAVRLVRWRVREALRVTSRRWVQAAGGAALAGMMAGLLGGALLVAAPGAAPPLTAIPVLMTLGAVAGFIGAAGVAAGIAVAEAISRSRRSVAIVAGGAMGGAAIGLVVQLLASWTLANVFGLSVPIGGALEGACLGAAVSVGYAVTTARFGGGIVAPQGRARWSAALTAAVAAGLTAAALARLGYPLVGGIVNHVAEASRGSQIGLTALGAWLGEPAFGPVTQALVAMAEGAFFGFGLTWGLTQRSPR